MTFNAWRCFYVDSLKSLMQFWLEDILSYSAAMKKEPEYSTLISLHRKSQCICDYRRSSSMHTLLEIRTSIWKQFRFLLHHHFSHLVSILLLIHLAHLSKPSQCGKQANKQDIRILETVTWSVCGTASISWILSECADSSWITSRV